MHRTVQSPVPHTPLGVTPGSSTSAMRRRPQLLLLAGGTTMLSWPDAFRETLARGGRHVVRYDLRDSWRV